MAGTPAHLPHFNKINCGNQSGPTQTNASCCIRLDISLAISRSIPNMRKLASPGHPFDGCFPTPSITARFRSISSCRNAVWRSAFVVPSRGLLLGLQAVIYAPDSAQFLLHAAAKAEFGSPILSVKGESPKTWYSVSRNARIVSWSIRGRAGQGAGGRAAGGGQAGHQVAGVARGERSGFRPVSQRAVAPAGDRSY